MELITVIVPVYNVEMYLEECLNSIINQTYRNIEIILIDDGATDLSSEICDKFSQKDTRIKVVHKTNGGLSDARNVGIDLAQGEYLVFIDSDDFIEIDMIEILYKNLKKYDTQISVCGFDYYKEKNFCKKYTKKDYEIVLLQEDAILKMLDINNVLGWTAWNKLYKKELFCDLKYPCGKLYEDMATTYKVFLKASKIYFTTKVKYHYRIRKNSIMTTKNLKKKEQDRYEIAKKMYDDLEKVFYKNKIIQREINVFLLTQYMEIINTMIMTNEIDKKMINFVKKEITIRLKSLLFSKILLIKKVQYIIFLFSYNVYAKMYKKIKMNDLN